MLLDWWSVLAHCPRVADERCACVTSTSAWLLNERLQKIRLADMLLHLLVCTSRSFALGGLLSNIRVDNAAKITITVSEIRFSFWKCVWAFLRAPTQTHLLCIEVSDVHVLVTLEKNQSTKLPAKESSQGNAFAQLAELLDLDVSLKNLEHTIWSPIRAWIHRLTFLCYFVHLVVVSVTFITVDVVDGEAAAQSAIISVKVRNIVPASLFFHCFVVDLSNK